MGNIKGLGLRRTKVFFMRLTEQEKKVLKRNADRFGLAMVEYVRCKIFDIPFEEMSGKLDLKTAKVKNNAEPAAATNPIP